MKKNRKIVELHRAIKNSELKDIADLIKEDVDPFEKLNGVSAFETKASPENVRQFEQILLEHYLNNPRISITQEQLDYALRVAARLQYPDRVTLKNFDDYTWSSRSCYISALIRKGANPLVLNERKQSAFDIAHENQTLYTVNDYSSRDIIRIFPKISRTQDRLTESMFIDIYQKVGFNQYCEFIAKKIIDYCATPAGREDIQIRLQKVARIISRSHDAFPGNGRALNDTFHNEVKQKDPLQILADEKYFYKRWISGGFESLPRLCLEFLLKDATYLPPLPFSHSSLFKENVKFDLMINISKHIRASLKPKPVVTLSPTHDEKNQPKQVVTYQKPTQDLAKLSFITEYRENLQSKMIELQTLTGSLDISSLKQRH